MIEILADETPFDRRVALLDAGRLRRLLIDDPASNEPQPEMLYAARIRTRERGMAGGFADLGGGNAAFLPDRAMAGETEGALVLAEVRRAAMGDKLAVLGRPRLHGRGQRLALDDAAPDSSLPADHSDPEQLAEERARLQAEAAALRGRFEAAVRGGSPQVLKSAPEPFHRMIRDCGSEIPTRIAVAGVSDAARLRRWVETHEPGLAGAVEGAGPDLFERFGVEEAIDSLLDAVVPLDGGGRMSLEPTRALLAVDVDAGAALGSGSKGSLAHTINHEALGRLPRELALRDLGGLVVVDLMGQPRGREAASLVRTFKAGLARWGLEAIVGPVSRFGLLEFSLPVLRPPLGRRLGSLEGAAARALRALWAEAVASPGSSLSLAAAPELHRTLAKRAEAVSAWAAARGIRPWAQVEKANWSSSRFEVTQGAVMS